MKTRSPWHWVLVAAFLACPFVAPRRAVASDWPLESLQPRNVLSIEPGALLTDGVEIDGERYFLHHRLSALVALGGQWSAQGDYSSWTVSLGTALRVWLNVAQPAFMHHLGGPFVGARVDGAFDALHEKLFDTTLDSFQLAGSLRVGYRFIFYDRVEFTPEAGAALTLGLDETPWLAGVPRFSWVFGGTLGYLFGR